MSDADHHRPRLLIILDGWGYSENPHANAVYAADTPNWDRLWRDAPHTLIRASGAEVGLPAGQMGNSEVGHLNLGAGRVVYQEFTRVSRAIKTGSFFSNATLTEAVDAAVSGGHAVHILGLLSPGGVHSHEQHIHAMVKLAAERGAQQLYLHAFLDGRDTPPKSASDSIAAMAACFEQCGQGRFSSVMGRYYAMDRDNRWPRIQAAYECIIGRAAPCHAASAEAALAQAYARGESDEFVQPTTIGDAVTINAGDLVVFMNYRSDRARQLTRAFIEPQFNCFERRHWPQPLPFVALTEYSAEFDLPVAFPPERMRQVFGEQIANFGLHQLRIAETEKYAHVTFFFNGGREEPFPFEDRILIPSPAVATYDQQPEMSAPELTRQLIAAIEAGAHDVIIANYANPDMVGHTGKFAATVAALEQIDRSLGELEAALQRCGGEMLITADHGNAEQMLGEDTGQAHTAHTSNPVPLIYVGPRTLTLQQQGGALCDIAPTLLALLGLPQPSEMSGHSLLADSAGEPSDD